MQEAKGNKNDKKEFLIYPYWNINYHSSDTFFEFSNVSNLSILEYKSIISIKDKDDLVGF